MKSRQSRKTTRHHREHRAHSPPADELTMRFLMRLWAGDTITVSPSGDELHLTRVGDPGTVFAVPVGLLDELEFRHGWIHPPEAGQLIRLTYAGKTALAGWMRRTQPGRRAAVNLRGERLEFGR